MDLRDALTLAAERIPFETEQERRDTQKAFRHLADVVELVCTHGLCSPAETQSEPRKPGPAPRKTAPRKATRTRAK